MLGLSLLDADFSAALSVGFFSWELNCAVAMARASSPVSQRKLISSTPRRGGFGRAVKSIIGAPSRRSEGFERRFVSRHVAVTLGVTSPAKSLGRTGLVTRSVTATILTQNRSPRLG